MVAAPEVAFTSPSSMRRVVVLPAPLGPRKPVTRPGTTVNETSWTATTEPNLLVRPRTSIAPPAGGWAAVTAAPYPAAVPPEGYRSMTWRMTSPRLRACKPSLTPSSPKRLVTIPSRSSRPFFHSRMSRWNSVRTSAPP